MKFAGYQIVFICLMAVCVSPAMAQIRKDPRPDFITTLNEQNIMAFLAEVSDISTGQRPEMLDDDVVNYFNNHMFDRGEFKSTMRYEIPGFPTQDAEMKLDKENYINTVVNGRYMIENYQSDIQIKDLKIGGGGKNATFTSIIKEKGEMPFPKDSKKPDSLELVPIVGESVCEQRLIVSFNNFIQMANADCKTVISFDPFGGKPLVPQ